MSTTAYLSLGSNLGDRQAYLRQAILELGSIGQVTAISSYYETEPVDFTDQPWFLNCAVALETKVKTPIELMRSILDIERAMGRERVQKKGPRIIDIDILLFGNVVVDSEEMIIPHPAMHKRRFVLEPLAEIAPEVHHPAFKKTIRELLRVLSSVQTVRRIPSS
jgi:2-amino-4-hydroxy-6-hydroxymethyldihydropteridine diphosphokinase